MLRFTLATLVTAAAIAAFTARADPERSAGRDGVTLDVPDGGAVSRSSPPTTHPGRR